MRRLLLEDGAQFEVAIMRDREGRYQVSAAGDDVVVEVLDPLTALLEGGAAGAARRRSQQVRAYMPGRVVALLVAEGDAVTAGQGLVVLEAMKMQNEIVAEHAGVVKRIHVAAGESVDGGAPLFDLE
jgi:pyruvate carboxylase subunit B